MAKDLFSLENKYCVVFGGAGYLGNATVEALLNQGAKVVVADVFPEYGVKNTERFEGNPNCVLFKCDIRNVEEIRAAYDKCLEAFGKFNVMINFANYGKFGPIDTLSDEDWAAGMEGRINSTFRCIREVIPYFEKNDDSCIVNTASMYGVVSPDYRIYGTSGQNSPPNYGAGKAAIVNLTRYAAAHLAPRHIRVNAVTPGPFPDSRKLPPPEFQAELSRKTMLGRFGKNTEICGAYLYLISDMASFTTGENIIVDGGWTAW